MKKELSLFLSLVIVLGVCLFAPFAINSKAATVDDLTFELNDDGQSYYVSGYNDGISGNVTIPETYNGLPVTRIGDSVFKDCTLFESITIPDSMLSIGSKAFSGCSSLNAVYISNIASWCSIDFADLLANPLCNAKELYLNNSLLKNMVIPEGVVEIKPYVFSNCSSITGVKIPKSLEKIGTAAFCYCENITMVVVSELNQWCEIEFASYMSNPLYYAKNLYLNSELVVDAIIPEGTTRINNYAFYNCTSLVSIDLPDTITDIGAYAFSGCISLSSITIPDSVISIGASAFSNCASVLDISIPDGVTEIKTSTFSGCESLQSITIPDSVSYIGYEAFYDCSELKAIYITDITSWCNIEFDGSYSITKITYSNPLYYAGKLYLNGKLLTNLVIPEGVTEIKKSAFEGYTSLRSVKIPYGVTKIGENAFRLCNSLNNIEIPETVENIGYLAFQGCFSLKNIAIPDAVTIIEDYTFDSCSNLKSVTIGKGVKKIGECAFSYCDALEKVFIKDIYNWFTMDFHSNYVIPAGSYDDCYISNPLYYAKELYLNGELVTNIKVPNDIKVIESYTFNNCSSITSITIPSSVTTIGANAFNNCTELQYVLYEGSSTEWSNISLGRGNSNLTSAIIHYNAIDHSHRITYTKPFFEGMEGSIDDVCPICGYVNSSEKLVWVNDHITAVDTKNTVIDTTSNTLLLDMSACKDINEAIVEMDGYTLTTTPTSSYGFIGTGSKVQVADSTGTQVAEYTLVVRGDVNGDSVCDSLDLMLIELARQTNNNVSLEGAYFSAANLAEDSEINIDDFNAVVNKAIA